MLKSYPIKRFEQEFSAKLLEPEHITSPTSQTFTNITCAPSRGGFRTDKS